MNGIPLFHKNSSKMTFLTSENCTSKSAGNIIKELNTVNIIYNARGFNVEFFHGGNELNLNALI